MILDSNSERPIINYPCEWTYKIIGNNIDKMILTVNDALTNIEHELTPSNISKKGKYYSLNIKLIVDSEVMRDMIYKKLKEGPAIIMVL